MADVVFGKSVTASRLTKISESAVGPDEGPRDALFAQDVILRIDHHQGRVAFFEAHVQDPLRLVDDSWERALRAVTPRSSARPGIEPCRSSCGRRRPRRAVADR